MPDIGTIVSVIFPLMTAIALGGCALLYSVQTTLRANNGDLERRVDILEAEGRRKDEKIASQQKELSGQAGELAALAKVITGEVQLVAITDLLTEHHSQAVKEWNELNGILMRIDTTMAAVLALLRDRPPGTL